MPLDLDLSDAPEASPEQQLGLDLSEAKPAAQAPGLDLSDALDADKVQEPQDEGALKTLEQSYRGLAAGSAGLGQAAGAGVQWLGKRLGSETLAQGGESLADYYEGQVQAYGPGEDISGSVFQNPEQLGRASWWAYNLFNSIPSLAATVLPGMGTAKVLRLGGAAMEVTPQVMDRLARIGMAVGGGAAGGAMEGASTYREVLRQGGSEDEAARAGEFMAAFSAGLNAVSLDTMFGKAGAGIGRRVVAGLTEGVTEAAEEPGEELSKDLAAYLETGAMPQGTWERMVAAARDRGLNVLGPSAILGFAGAGAGQESEGPAMIRPADLTGREQAQGQEAQGQEAQAAPASGEAAASLGPDTVSGSDQAPDAADVLPYTRADAEQDLAQRFGDKDGKDLLGLFDALAESWAEREGLSPDQWFEKHLAGIVATDQEGVLAAGDLFQPSREEIRLADEALASDVAAWGESVDALGQGQRVNMTMLNQTPLVMQMLGAGNLPVQMAPGKLATAMEKHGLSPELVKQVPGAMADPVMVFRSATQGGDMVMMLELKDQHGGTVVVPITLEKTTPGGYSANIATSIYGKTDKETGQPVNAWFSSQIENGNLLYRNNKKSRDWARTSGLRLPGANSRSISAGQRIYTDADLVKLREANPTLYQSGKARWSYGQEAQFGPGLELEAVRRAVAPLQDTAANAAPLEVVADVAALPEHLQVQADHGQGRPEAVRDPETGKVFILADAVGTPEQAVALWLHEQGLHGGLRGLFGPDAARLDAFLDQTFEHFGAESFTDLAQAHGLDLATEDGRRRAAEERLAVLAEKVNLGEALDEREQGLWDRLVELVRAWLRERGVDVGISDADIARTVMDAVRWTVQGDGQAPRTLYQGAKLEQALDYGRRVDEASNQWGEVVDKAVAGELHPRAALKMGQTPDALVTMGIPDLPMVMDKSTLDKVTGGKAKRGSAHNLTTKQVKALYREMSDPVAVLKYGETGYTIVTRQVEAGNPVIVGLDAAVESGRVRVNEITSAYGKEGFGGWLLARTKKGDLLYLNKNETAAILEDMSGPRLAGVLQARRVSGQKLLHETDIVKPIPPGGLNQRGATAQDGPRAAVSFMEDGRALVRLFRTADASSVIHEAAHVIRPFLPAEDMAVVERWAGVKDGRWTTEAEEKFARAFERYCYEAKAPTARLRQVLSRLRRMLVQIYGKLKNLGVDPIPDDVRQVFDRMLSTEKEREAERATLAAIHSFGVSPEVLEASYDEPPAHPSDIQEWSDLMAEAERRAQANFDKERNKELRSLRAAWRAEGQEVADSHAAHRFMDQFMGMGAEGLSQDYDSDTIMALNQKRPGLVRKGGLPYDMAMQAAGVEDSDAMITQILEAPTKAQIIKDWMEQREAEYLRLKAQSEDFGQEYFAVQDAALEILGQMTEKRVDQVRRQRAKAEVDEMLAADLGRTGQRLRAERGKLLAQAKAAFDSGDRVGALRAMNNLRDSDTLLREIERARLERETIARSVTASLARRIPEEYREQALAWAGRMGARNVGATPRQTLLEFLHLKKLLPFVNRDAIAVLEKYPHTTWSVDQMRYAKDVLRQVVYFGATEGKLLAGKEALDFEQTMARVVSAIKAPPRPDVAIHPLPVNERRPGSFGQFLEGTNRAMAQMLKAEHVFRSLDSGQDMGPVWTACMKPVADARNEFLRLGQEASARLEAALAPVRERMTAWRKQKLSIKEIPRNIIQKRGVKNGQWTTEVQAGVPLLLSRESVFMAALNMGNLGNREALKAGCMWTEGDLAAISRKLTAGEWKMVQDVWDAIDGLYPHLNAVHRKLTGVTLRKVEAAPFQVQTADGQTLEIRGGYFPLQFDRGLSVRADQLGAVADIMEETRGVHFNPRPARGMTIERQGGRMAPLLSFEVISRHLLDTVHYASHALAIRDVDRIILDPRFRETVEAARGKDEYAQIRPWLQNVARPSREPRTVLELWMRRLRKNVQFAALAYRIPTAMIQLTSLTSTVNSLGFWPTARAAVSVLTSPSESWAFANDRSIALRNRRRSFDRDVVNNLGRFQAGWGNVSDAMLEWGMMPIGLVDSLAAHVTWLAAYKKAMDTNGWDEAKACEYADMTVRMSQGEGTAMSLSQVQSKPALELVTIFYSWFNTNYNNIVAAHRARKYDGGSRMDMARSAFWLLVAPVVMESLWKKGVPDDGDDWEELGKDVLTYGMSNFPILRDMATPMITGYRPRISPVMVAWEAPSNLVNAFQAKENRGRKVAKAAMQFAGAFTIFPTTAAVTAMNGALDLIQGKTENPARLVFPAGRDEKKKKRMTYGGGK